MRRPDRPLALACLDQPQILRQVFRALRKTTASSARGRDDRAYYRRNADRTRTPARGTASHYSARRCHRRADCHTVASNDRTALSLWSANEEGHTVFATRAWSSALLATQGNAGDVVAGDADNQRVIA